MGMAAFLLLCTVSIKAYHLFFKGKERLSKYTIVVTSFTYLNDASWLGNCNIFHGNSFS